MTCLDDNEVLALLDGALVATRREELEQHLDRCERCRAFVAAMARVERDEPVAAGSTLPVITPDPADALAAGAPALFSVGEVVDQYEILRPIGQGGMGWVYLAQDTTLARKVALKVIHPRLLRTAEATARFLAEARITATFNHPSIVTVYGVGEHGGRRYLSLEYLDGQSLGRRIAQDRPATRESLRIALAIAEALAHAHGRGILHGDLKPDNVMIPTDGRVRVLDFGLAQHFAPVAETGDHGGDGGDGGDGGGTAGRRPIQGTPAYLAPEQLVSGGCSEATDVWCLGGVLHELLTGARVARDDDGQAVIDLDDELPAALRELVAGCLAPRPAERPAAGRVVEVLRASLDDAPAIDPELSPYRGLLPFDERHAALFFGREAEIAGFVERLRDVAALSVVGPSGVGKSSFVRAGVIPRLRDQGRWVVLSVRPGAHPFAALATELAAAGQDGEGLAERLRASPRRLSLELRELARRRGARVLLLVDQLEEIYALVADPARRLGFMEAICTAADDVADPVRVVFTLRDDFLHRLAESDVARAALSQLVILHRPAREALRETLVRPLAAVGYRFDDAALPDEMVAAVAGDVACLPLLQFATQTLWDRRDRARRTLSRAVYDELGGVGGALARHADGVLKGLGRAQLRLVRQLLLRLVSAEGTRRVVPRTELLEGLDPAADELLRRLTGARLVTVRVTGDDEDPALELAHESLIRSWTRLARWIDASREELVFVAEVEPAATLWHRRGRREEGLWRGEALHEALRTVERCAPQLPPLLADFLAAGQRVDRRRARTTRLRRLALLTSLVLVAIGSAAAALGLARQKREVARQKTEVVRQKGEAERQRSQAQREGALAALLGQDLLEARAKLRASLETQDSTLGRVLWGKLAREPQIWTRRMNGQVSRVAISHDGRTIATVSLGEIYLIDVETRRARVLRAHTDQMTAVAFARDGRLATGDWGGVIRIWDLRPRRPVSRALAGRHPQVGALAFGPDGRVLASAGGESTRLWAVASGSEIARLPERFVSTATAAVCFSPDGKLIATAGGAHGLQLWRVSSREPIRRLGGHDGRARAVVFDPTGRLLASAGHDQAVRIWQVSNGAAVAVLRHAAGVNGLSFSPDGRRIASGDASGLIRLWRVSSGDVELTLRGNPRGVEDLIISPRGQVLVSAGFKQLSLWSLRPTARRLAASGHAGVVNGVSFSPDGETLASGGSDGTVRLWRVDTGGQRAVLSGHRHRVFGVVFGEAGRLLVSTSMDRTLRLWQPQTGAPLRVIDGHTAAVVAAAISRDGQLIATASIDRTVRLWDARTGNERATLRHPDRALGVAFSPDGRRLASACGDGLVRLWRLPSATLEAAWPGHTARVYAVAFRPDGGLLASTSYDRTVRLWNPRSGRSEVLGPFAGRAYEITFDPTGQRLGLPQSDTTARIVALARGKGRVLRGHRGEVNAVRFSPDGKLAASSSDDGTVRLWNVESGRPVWRAPLLLADPPRVLTHRGWLALRPSGVVPAAPPAGRWARAVEEEALNASISASRLLCLRAADDRLVIWDLVADRQLAAHRLPKLSGVLATPAGCLTLADGQVRSHGRAGRAKLLVRSGAGALGQVAGELLVATRDRVLVFDRAGRQTASLPVDVGVTALTATARWVVAGYQDGSIELLPRGGAGPPRVTFEEVPSSPVVRLLAGPRGTLIVGYASGVLGLWSLESGRRLAATRLHGQMSHLLLTDNTLHAATDLGSTLVWELDELYAGYCDLLRRVWREVGVTWEGGRPVPRASPASHRCARTPAQL